MALCCCLGRNSAGPGERGRQAEGQEALGPPTSLRGANTTPKYSGLGFHQSDAGLSLGLA